MSVKEDIYHGFSDNELVVLVGSGDHIAFGVIYRRYWGILFIHAMKMVRDEDEVKDLLQELFTSLWSKSAELQISTSLSSYLYNAVRNRVFNLIEHQKIKRNYSTSISEYLQQGHFSTDEQVRVNELKKIIETEVSMLPKKMKEIFEMSRTQQFSHKEIAEKLGISDKTVRKQINNALKVLKVKLGVSGCLLLFLWMK